MADSQEMASENEYLYAVVLFLPKKEKNNLIDLIPCSWIYEKDEKNMFCCYPANEDYPKLPQWVASLRVPDKDWEHFDVEILAYARTIKQGQRRLKRAYKNLEVGSSDSENIPCNAQPVVLNNNDLEKELDNMPIIISSTIRNETVNDEPSLDQTMPTSCGEKTLTNGTEEDISAFIGLDNMFISAHLREYLDEKFKTVVKTIKSAKRSILYDVEKKTNQLKLAIINSNAIAMPNANINDIETKLKVVFPIRTIEDFLLFEEAIGTSEEKKKALIKWNQILIFGETCIKKCVRRIMTSTLSKTVEMEYSAYGRQTHGKGKRDFSKTQTYSCLNGVLQEKFGEHGELYKQLPSIISRWLSGAVDREGGRKTRRSSCVTES